MTERPSLPRFVEEALEDDLNPALDPVAEHEPAIEHNRIDALVAERSLLLLERALAAARADPEHAELDLSRGRARLERALSNPPERYAPFVARAAELFDLSEAELEAQLARLCNSGAWRFAGLPGIAHVAVRGGPRVRGAETLLVRFRSGVYFPRHDHTGVERVLVLEGSYVDSHGVRHGPGELREWAPGTEHSFKVGTAEPCIFASVVFGRRFGAWPLRALAALLGR